MMYVKEIGKRVGQNIRAIRRSLVPIPTQAEVAALLGLEMKLYQAIELGRSVKGARLAVPRLAELWNRREEEFWGNPDSGERISVGLGVQSNVETLVDISLHEPNLTGKVILLNPTRKLTITADLARLNPIAITVPDDENAPRFRRGMKVLAVPRLLYEDNSWVLIEHLHETAGPVAYIRRYEYVGGRYEYRAVDAHVAPFQESDVKILGLVVLRRVEHAQGWYSDERCDTGLPLHAP